MSLNVIASPAAREPGPRVIFGWCRTVPKVNAACGCRGSLTALLVDPADRSINPGW
jgi:hypothetical protein